MSSVKKTFAALVAVYMLAEQMDDEKLRQIFEGMPRLPQWQEVRAILQCEMRRREGPGTAAEDTDENAA